MKKIILLSLLMTLTLQLFAGDKAGNGYVAHEWGTFTSVQGSDGVVLRWNSVAVSKLPGFVYAQNHPYNDPEQDRNALLFGGKGMGTWLQRMETPVIYFYPDKEQEVSAEVSFPQGQITEWFPQLSSLGSPIIYMAAPPGQNRNTIRWNKLKISPMDDSSSKPQFPIDSSGNHYFTARETDSATITTTAAMGVKPKTEQEKFLFYRGVGNFQAPLTVQFQGKSLSLINNGAEPLKRLFLLQVSGGKAAFAPIKELASGSASQMLLFTPADMRSVDTTAQALEKAMADGLAGEGLYAREATAMVKTWEDSWFKEEGVRILYVLPRAWTDQILPLTLTPTPKELVRVMVGRAEIFTPEVEQELKQTFTKFENPGTRDEAFATIRKLKLGRFVAPAMARLVELETREVNEKVNDLARTLGQKSATENSLALR